MLRLIPKRSNPLLTEYKGREIENISCKQIWLMYLMITVHV